MLYFGKEVGASEIPDSKVRASSAEANVFQGFSPHVSLGFSLKLGSEEKTFRACFPH